jgi:hypothetical protein
MVEGKMKQKEILHILRNPYGWDEDTIGRAMLEACELIEELQFQLDIWKNYSRMKDAGKI